MSRVVLSAAPAAIVGRYEEPSVVDAAVAAVGVVEGADLELWYPPGEPAVVIDVREAGLPPDLVIERYAVSLLSGATLSAAHSRYSTPDELDALSSAIARAFAHSGDWSLGSVPEWLRYLVDRLHERSNVDALALDRLDETRRP